MRHQEPAQYKPYGEYSSTALGSLLRAAFVLLLLLIPTTLCAQQGPRIDISSAAMRAPSSELIEALERRGDLVLRGSTLDAALFTINELWKVNIIAGQVEGEVNGVFKDAPLKEILDTILLGNGYGYRLVGESIVVSRLEQLGQINPFFVSEAMQVTNAKPSDLVEAARLLSTPQGQVQAIDSARSLIVVDFPERVQMIRDLVASVDAASTGPGMLDASGRPKALQVGYFHTQYISVADAKKVLATVLGPAGRAEAVDNEDRLIVVDFPENLAMAERVLTQIDRPRPQVQITALIYDLSLGDIEQLGINWAQAVNARTNGTPTSATQLTISNPFNPSASGALFTFSHLDDNFDLGSVAQAIQSASDSRLLANPNVTVMDNEQANFEAVTQIPFQQITQTGQGGQLAGTAFKDAGIKLDVVPKIAADGTIEMMVRPEFSRLTGFTPGDNQPIIDTRATSTSVRVRNGHTLVIGGMRQRSDVGDYGGVPGLKDIRWLGHLFRSRDTDIRESELVVFITPRIVGYSEPIQCREQLALDTVNCRLDLIPRPEGCPPGGRAYGGCHSGGCHGGGYGRGCGANAGCAGSVQMVPSATEWEVPYEPTIAPEPVEAPPADQSAARGDSNAQQPPQPSTPYPDMVAPLAVSPFRRLPPVTDDTITPLVPATQVATKPADAFRPDYDSRFRATGGVYSNEQRQLERTPEPRLSSDPTPKKSWWDKVLRR